MSGASDRPGPVSEFRGSLLPEPAILAGYSALIDKYELAVPLPPRLAAMGTRRNPPSSDAWRLVTNRQALPLTLGEHLEFALKHEGVNLSVLNAFFRVAPKKELEEWISKTPGGSSTRRIWFLYEWLTEQSLDVPPAPKIRRCHCKARSSRTLDSQTIASRRADAATTWRSRRRCGWARDAAR